MSSCKVEKLLVGSDSGWRLTSEDNRHVSMRRVSRAGLARIGSPRARTSGLRNAPHAIVATLPAPLPDPASVRDLLGTQRLLAHRLRGARRAGPPTAEPRPAEAPPWRAAPPRPGSCRFPLGPAAVPG